MRALEAVFPDITSEEAPPPSVGRLNYPRPISEPPSPTSTRAHSPTSSIGDQEVNFSKCIIFNKTFALLLSLSAKSNHDIILSVRRSCFMD